MTSDESGGPNSNADMDGELAPDAHDSTSDDGRCLWKIRLGARSSAVDFCESPERGWIGLGFANLDPVELRSGDRGSVETYIRSRYPEASGRDVGKLWSFARELHPGDLVVYQAPERGALIFAEVIDDELSRRDDEEGSAPDIWLYRNVVRRAEVPEGDADDALRASVKAKAAFHRVNTVSYRDIESQYLNHVGAEAGEDPEPVGSTDKHESDHSIAELTGTDIVVREQDGFSLPDVSKDRARSFLVATIDGRRFGSADDISDDISIENVTAWRARRSVVIERRRTSHATVRVSQWNSVRLGDSHKVGEESAVRAPQPNQILPRSRTFSSWTEGSNLQRSCKDCGGSGRRNCMECADGWRFKDERDADGTVRQVRVRCWVCQGRGQVGCWGECGGDGQVVDYEVLEILQAPDTVELGSTLPPLLKKFGSKKRRGDWVGPFSISAAPQGVPDELSDAVTTLMAPVSGELLRTMDVSFLPAWFVEYDASGKHHHNAIVRAGDQHLLVGPTPHSKSWKRMLIAISVAVVVAGGAIVGLVAVNGGFDGGASSDSGAVITGYELENYLTDNMQSKTDDEIDAVER